MSLTAHRVTAHDGWLLDILDLVPAGPPRGLVIAGHAMMVDRRTFRPDRPGLARTLVDAGFRVLLPDLRGHGRSGPTPREGGDWNYDQLVADTATHLALARVLAPDLPVALLGHSLYAHTSLAWLGQNPDAPVSVHIGLAMNVWLRACEPRRARWLLKRATMSAASALTSLLGYLPAARVGLGSMDEAASYWADIARVVREGAWTSREGVDYHAGLAAIRCPCLHVVSAGDRLLADPAASLSLTAPIPRRTIWRLGIEGELADLRPDHMGLLTGASEPLWRALAVWLDQQLPPVERP